MLRGASAEAQKALVADLRSRLDGGAGNSELGGQLFGVTSVLRTQAALRRIATDASIEGDAKADLVGNVFGKAVGQDPLDLLTDAVRRRWTTPRDLADVLEYLGVIATVRSAGDDGGRITDELFEVRQLVDQHHDLRSALSDPARTTADKVGLLHGLLDGKVQQATLVLVEQAVSGTHGAIDQALEEFQHIAASAQGEKIATVHTARELTEAESDRLATALSRQYDESVHLQIVLDPTLVGGLRVEIGDDVIDGTVATRLEDAQRKLAG